MPTANIHPLAHIRQAHGWSQADLAAIVAAHAQVNMAAARQKVYRWENGKAVPDLPSQYALADALGIPRRQVHACRWPGWLACEPVELEWTPENVGVVLSQVVASAGMDRRNFLVLSGSGLATAALTAAAPPLTAAASTPGSRVGADVIRALTARLEHLWYLDDALGGGACLDYAITDLRGAENILARNSYNLATERALYGLTASIDRFAGWAAFDGGRHAAAQRLWHAGLRIAMAIGDRLQAAYILSNLALQDIYVNGGRDAVDQLEAARAMVDPACRKVHAMLDCWQARAHACRGEKTQTAALLNRGDATWDKHRDGDDPQWIYWMPPPTRTSEAGTAMLQIGETSRAEAILTEGMTERNLPEAHSRDRCLYLIRLAELHIATGHLDIAAAHASTAIDASAEVDSHRVNTRVDELLAMFPANEPATDALKEHAVAARQPVAV